MIQTMKELRVYCETHQKDFDRVSGICTNCCYRKECQRRLKYVTALGLLNMRREDSRFPGFVFDLFHYHPKALNLIPMWFFVMLYGNHEKSKELYNQCSGCVFYGSRSIVSNLDQIESVYGLLEDELSKQAYINVIMYRLTADKRYIMNARTEEHQYFISSFCGGGSDAIYVDGGAYTGDTFLEYCRFNAAPKKAYLFEPDPANMKKLLENVKPYQGRTEIIPVQKGLYNKESKLYFYKFNNTSSNFSEQEHPGSEIADVTSIDAIIKDDVSFIKMDIEAFEPFALQGAQQTIMRSYPKLAICIYHRMEHL